MNFQSHISQFFFLLHKNNHDILSRRLHHLLRELKKKPSLHIQYLKTLYLLILHTRDISGHGLRDISYMMILVWYDYYPILSIFALHQLVGHSSWNDIKYFAKYVYHHHDEYHPLIDSLVSIANRQLRNDHAALYKGLPISNVSKWIPRENKMPWFFFKCSQNWSPHSNHTFSTHKKIYRTTISTLSTLSHIETNKNLFSSILHKPQQSVPYNSFFQGNMFAGDYVRLAINIIDKYNIIEYSQDFDSLYDVQWLHFKWSLLSYSFSSKFFPIVDMSISIPLEDFFNAIGLAILLAIQSKSYRILFISHIPIWVHILPKQSFCSIIHNIFSFANFRTSSKFIKIPYIPHHRVVLFSQDFEFDFSHLSQVVLWNIGGKNIIHHSILYSGYSPGLLSNIDFHSYDSYQTILHSLSGKFTHLERYFDSFTS
jgi:hypothetical protein